MFSKKLAKHVTSSSSQMEWDDSSMTGILRVLFYSIYVYMCVSLCGCMQVCLGIHEARRKCSIPWS